MKPNAMLAKLQAQYEVRSARKVNVAMQMAKDVADMAAAEMFGMGEGRAEKWTKIYSDILNDMMRMIASDNEDDQEIVYSRAKVDERLKQIYGKHFQPWEARYSD